MVEGRKLIISMNVTLDGFMSGPNHELDWHVNGWTAEMAEFMCEQLYNADTLLLGRVTYEAMAAYWTVKDVDKYCPVEDRAFADMINNYTKIVVSTKNIRHSWKNTIQARNNIRNAIALLKKQSGKDIIVYGSGKLLYSLLNYKLVDEFHLYVHPVLIGDGTPMFRNVSEYDNLVLFRKEEFRSGVVACLYRYINKFER